MGIRAAATGMWVEGGLAVAAGLAIGWVGKAWLAWRSFGVCVLVPPAN